MNQRREVLLGAVLIAFVAVRAEAQARGGTQPARPAAAAQITRAPMLEVDPFWPKPMPNHRLLGSATGVAVDSRDHVFVLNLPNTFTTRTETGADQTPPIGECCFPSLNVLEFDPQGNLVGQWGGAGQGFDWPSSNSGIAVDAVGNVWIGGAGGLDAHILKFSRDGKFVQQIGKPGSPPAPPPAAAPVAPDTTGGRAGGAGRGFAVVAGRGGGRGRGGAPPPMTPPNSHAMDAFGGAIRIAIDAKASEAYVADGARNRRVAVVDLATGTIKRYWGAYGNRPDDAPLGPYNPDAPPAQQFATVACAVPSADGLVYVCDRGNNRIQVFKSDGSFVKEARIAPQTRGEGSVWDIAFSRDPQQRYLYVADGSNMKVHVLDRQSLAVLTTYGDGGKQPGQFLAVHSVSVDSKGNVYTAETLQGKRVQKFIFKGVGAVTKANLGVVWPKRAGE